MIDRDVVNLFHYMLLKRDIRIEFHEVQSFLFSPDTFDDASMYMEKTKRKLPAQIRALLRDVDEQLCALPKNDFLFGYPLLEPQRKTRDRRPCLVAMPSGEELKNVQAAIENAARKAGFECNVLVDRETPGLITDQIWNYIRRAEVVVTEITGHNPNVMYELGLAMALGKKVIIATGDKAPLPFDISTYRVIRYKDTTKLEARLKKAFSEVPKRYSFDGMLDA